jgi:hypothetical protein
MGGWLSWVGSWAWCAQRQTGTRHLDRAGRQGGSRDLEEGQVRCAVREEFCSLEGALSMVEGRVMVCWGNWWVRREVATIAHRLIILIVRGLHERIMATSRVVSAAP